MKHKRKKLLWSIIPLLFVGLLGVTFLSLPGVHAKADGTGQPTPCDQNPNSKLILQNTTVSGQQVPSITVWQCQTDPFLKATNFVLNMRDAPHLNANIMRTSAFNDTGSLLVVCQTQGDNVGGSKIWDKIITTDPNSQGSNGQSQQIYAYVADYYVATSNYGNFSSPIPQC